MPETKPAQAKSHPAPAGAGRLNDQCQVLGKKTQKPVWESDPTPSPGTAPTYGPAPEHNDTIPAEGCKGPGWPPTEDQLWSPHNEL